MTISKINRKRQSEIIQYHKEGLSYQKIGDLFGISRQRAHRIATKEVIHNHDPEFDYIMWNGKQKHIRLRPKERIELK